MRVLSGTLGVLLLLALLTWLLLRGIDTNAPAYAVTLQAFDDFTLAEASLHRDVMQARAGLLGTSPTFGDQAAQLAPAIGALAAAILHLTRDSSPDAAKALQERIDRFAA